MPQWELLVTDGHVRAARWRVASKFVVVSGILFIVLGMTGLWVLPPRKSSSHLPEAKQRLVEARRESLAKFLASKGSTPQSLPANADKAFAPTQMPALVDNLSLQLNKTDTLPQDVSKLSPKDFWNGDWQPGAVAAVTGKRSILIGFYVNQAAAYPHFQGTEPQTALTRIFGLFRKANRQNESKWAFYCLNVPGSPPCGRNASLSPELLPETFNELVPAEARS